MFAFHFYRKTNYRYRAHKIRSLLKDNGSGSLIKTWDHLIFGIGGVGTRYTDEVSIDAGLFTLPIYIYAFIFTPIDKCDGGN